MMQVIIFQMPLIATLRPSANLSLLRFDVFNFFTVESLPGCEDDNPGAIGISQHDCITAILIDQTSERIKMRAIINKKLVSLERGLELPSLEKITGARTSKNRQALRGRPEFVFEKALDTYKICVKTIPLRRFSAVSARAAAEFFANERTKIMFAMFVGARVEIKTNHRKIARDKSGQSLEHLFR